MEIDQKKELLTKITSMLDGRQYRDELTEEIKRFAKDNGIVIVYGASDDLMEIDGIIYDEVGCSNGTIVCLDKDGVFEDCYDSCKHSEIAKDKCKRIKVIWGKGEYSRTYETDIYNETFDIYEDDDKYCRGIVFLVSDL